MFCNKWKEAAFQVINLNKYLSNFKTSLLFAKSKLSENSLLVSLVQSDFRVGQSLGQFGDRQHRKEDSLHVWQGDYEVRCIFVRSRTNSIKHFRRNRHLRKLYALHVFVLGTSALMHIEPNLTLHSTLQTKKPVHLWNPAGPGVG